MNKDYPKIMTTTTVLLILAIFFTFITFRTQMAGTLTIWSHIMPIITSLIILYTDAYMLRKLNTLTEKRKLLNFLLLGSLCVIVFQVICDFLYLNPIDDWHNIIFDIMFNVSFCMLFIITFKFADVYWLDLFDKIDMNK